MSLPPIAVVGIGGIFPQAQDPGQFYGQVIGEDTNVGLITAQDNCFPALYA